MHISRYRGRIVTPGWKPGLSRLRRMLGCQVGGISLNLRVAPMPPQKIPCPGSGEPEQGLVDEVYGGGGALDVQQDSAELLQLDAVRTGM